MIWAINQKRSEQVLITNMCYLIVIKDAQKAVSSAPAQIIQMKYLQMIAALSAVDRGVSIMNTNLWNLNVKNYELKRTMVYNKSK